MVKILDSLLDLAFVRGNVNDENERVVVLNLLHSRLSRERVLDHSKLVHRREALLRGESVHGFSDILWLANKFDRLRFEEVGLGADLHRLLTSILADYSFSHDTIYSVRKEKGGKE